MVGTASNIDIEKHYNYFRDYEPGIGRYVQSDPIGLKGGNSTYSYVGQRPISARDPYGLVKWEGSGFSGSMGLGLGGGMESYTLVSECKCGKRVTVGVAVMYGVVGKGRFQSLGPQEGHVSLTDPVPKCKRPWKASL
ncbi:MAG: RHS repeat-associated core domain-containing protein [Betaproteobacteria bacterium]|nr:RHS repeat-associated core domain-containing protein [Betaproteobacteria bacterium]